MKSSSNQNLNPPQIKIGVVSSAHGLKGGFKIFVFSKEAPYRQSLKEITLKSGENFQTYEILKVAFDGESLNVQVKEINDRNDAEKLKGSEVYILEKFLTSKKGEAIFLREILGFMVLDRGEKIGLVKGFEASSAQDILIVNDEKNQKEVLIPLVKDFLERIDFATKEIFMSLPEGLRE